MPLARSVPPAERSPVDALRHSESWPLVSALVRAAAKALPEEQRHVVRAIYWDLRSHGDLACEFGVRPDLIVRIEDKALRHLGRELVPLCRVILAGGQGSAEAA